MSHLAGRSFARGRWLTITVCAGLLAASALYERATGPGGGPILCPFRLATGLPCPGCGMTRGFCAMARGDLPAAVSWNPLSLPLFGLVLAVLIVAAVDLVRGRPSVRCDPVWAAWLAGGGALAAWSVHLVRVVCWGWRG